MQWWLPFLFALLISKYGIGLLKKGSANTVNSYVFLRILNKYQAYPPISIKINFYCVDKTQWFIYISELIIKP